MDAVTDMTRGQMADSAIPTVGSMNAEVVEEGFNLIGKGGTVVVTGVNRIAEKTIDLSGAVLNQYRKQIEGSLFGACNPTTDIPKILGLYQSGDLKLDELVTQDLQARRHQPGIRRLASGQEHPRCRRARTLVLGPGGLSHSGLG